MGSNANDLAAANLFNVDGLVALVTGGGTGIGLMMAKALVQNGAAKVYIVGRRLEVLQAAASQVGSAVIPVVCDVTSKEELLSAAAFVEKDCGHLNLLICNSGVTGPMPPDALTPETTLEQWADANLAIDSGKYLDTFAVNTVAVWYTTMAFLKLLDAGNKKGNVQQSSQVIVTSSIAAFNKKAPGGWAYGQSKTAATLATKQLAVMMPQWNIRVNSITPGLFPSEMSAPIIQRFSGSDGREGSVPAQMVPMQRVGDSQDMAGVTLYLASRAGAYCSGAVIVVDGGRLGLFPAIN